MLSRRLLKNSKGYSGIIAAIFLILIVLLLYSSVFMYMLNQNTSFQDVVSEVNQADIDRSNEQITVSNVNYTGLEGQVNVEAQVTNDGPVSVKIVTLWVLDTTTRKYGFNSTLEINLKTGETLNLTGSDAVTVKIDGLDLEELEELEVRGRLTSWFVTARGNLKPLELYTGVAAEAEEAWVSQYALMTYAMGPVLLNYRSLRWYSTITGLNGTWEIGKENTGTEWSLNVTNWGDEDVTLSYDCAFMIISVSQSMVWYIKEEYVLLPVEQEVVITFCWSKPGSGKLITSSLPPPDTFAVFVIMVGTFESGEHYAQTIPFVAIKIV